METQGRFDNGRGKEFADYYILMYTRSNPMVRHDNDDEDEDENDGTDSIGWIQYRPKLLSHDELNSSWIRANQNTYMGEIRQLSKIEMLDYSED